MNKDSLILLKDVITDAINNIPHKTIDEIDRVEALINIREFLSPENYDEDIKILIKQNDKRRYS